MADAAIVVDSQLAAGTFLQLALVRVLMVAEMPRALRRRDFVLATRGSHAPGKLERKQQGKHEDQ